VTPRTRQLIAACVALPIAVGLVVLGAVRRERVRVPEIVIDGVRRAESCLLCHDDVRGLGAEHDPATVGCSTCHLGDPTALDAERAHVGLEVLAGDLASVWRTCGQGGCHNEETARVSVGLMAGAPGILAVDRFAFGERGDPTPQASEDDLRRLAPSAAARSPAEDHVRKLCGSCHLAARKAGRGDLGFASRGGGCAACHLAPPRPERGREGARVHPSLSAAVPDARCEGCHARSGRIALSYRGIAEVEPGDARANGTLPDGRRTATTAADVHAVAGMGCVDCHSEQDLMGDGRSHAFAADAVGVECDDCHAADGASRVLRPEAGAVADRMRASWQRRGMPALPAAARPFITKTRAPLWRTDRTTQSLWLAATGARVAMPPKNDPAPYHAMPGHERLSCQSCHTVWAPRCTECHTTFEAGGRDVDHLAGEARAGHWREVAGGNGFGPPVLAVDGRGLIAPFIEGMRLNVDGLPSTVNRTLWAPLDPHTTGKSRSCASCHPRSALDAVYPRVGETTRPRARLLDAAERARVAAVSACVPCHERWDDPIYGDFRASAARAVTPEAGCGFSSPP
jgi:hypothetical protein